MSDPEDVPIFDPAEETFFKNNFPTGSLGLHEWIGAYLDPIGERKHEEL
jgi:hypothetical protein